jgi:hypothetical protein
MGATDTRRSTEKLRFPEDGTIRLMLLTRRFCSILGHPLQFLSYGGYVKVTTIHRSIENSGARVEPPGEGRENLRDSTRDHRRPWR